MIMDVGNLNFLPLFRPIHANLSKSLRWLTFSLPYLLIAPPHVFIFTFRSRQADYRTGT